MRVKVALTIEGVVRTCRGNRVGESSSDEL